MSKRSAQRDGHADIRELVRALCAKFPGEYWRALDRERAYPTEFVRALTEAGYLAALIPEEFGGSGLGISAAVAILEEVHASGGNGAACHAQMYTMGTILRHGNAEQKKTYLPKIASGELRLQAFGVTEPTSGTDTLSLRTTARREGNDHYVINGQKIWTSRAEHSDLMLLLGAHRAQGEDKKAHRRPVGVPGRHAAGAIDQHHHQSDPHDDEPRHHPGVLRRPARAGGKSDRRGRAGLPLHPGRHERRAHSDRGGMHRRCQMVHRQGDPAMRSERVLFGRPIGKNQGVQFPIARAYAQMRAAELMVHEAAAKYEVGEDVGPEANMAKLLAADASWFAADMCVQTHGGFGFAEEYDVERKFRETRLYQVAPISTNMILSYLAEHVLGLPRSY